jgi:hypothetical protein
MIERLSTYWEAFWWRLSDWAERLSTWLHPGYRIAPLTPERYERFMSFWQDLGFREAYESTQEEAMGDGMDGAAIPDMSSGEPEVSDEAAERIRRRFEKEGRLTELATILFDVPDRKAGEVPLDLVEAVLADFILACARHRARLLGMQSGTASSSAAA